MVYVMKLSISLMTILFFTSFVTLYAQLLPYFDVYPFIRLALRVIGLGSALAIITLAIFCAIKGRL